MIKGHELQNRDAASPPVPDYSVDERLQSLLVKIARARTTNKGEDQHCADCFRRGRDAVLKILDE